MHELNACMEFSSSSLAGVVVMKIVERERVTAGVTT